MIFRKKSQFVLKFGILNYHLFKSQIVLIMFPFFVIISTEKPNVFNVFLTSLGFEQY